jgi:hypothetical protein
MKTQNVSYILKAVSTFARQAGWSVSSLSFADASIYYTFSISEKNQFCPDSKKLLTCFNLLLISTGWQIQGDISDKTKLSCHISHYSGDPYKKSPFLDSQTRQAFFSLPHICQPKGDLTDADQKRN